MSHTEYKRLLGFHISSLRTKQLGLATYPTSKRIAKQGLVEGKHKRQKQQRQRANSFGIIKAYCS